MNSQSESLINHIKSNNYQTNAYSVSEENDYKLAAYISSLSKKDFKALISDRYWNTYPTYCYIKSGIDSGRGYYHLIFRAIRHLIYSSSHHKNAVINHGTGIFRMFAIQICLGNDKVVAAKKSLVQGDSRARKHAARILPIGDIKKHYHVERDSTIRTIIVNRIGFVEMAEMEESKSKDHYLLYKNFLNSKFSIDKIEDAIGKNFIINSVKLNKTSVIQKLCYYLEPQEAIFFLNLIKDNPTSKYERWVIKAFMDKVTGNSSV